MGIENAESLHVRRICVQLPLITPHGDRKRSSARAPGTCSARSHYPSWGSKTSRCTAAASSPCITPHGATHYPSWGSKTTALQPGTERAPRPTPHGDLITPHGDRKPLISTEVHGHRHRTHYPSWGSKTLASASAAHEAATKLITPHGDRKREGGSHAFRGSEHVSASTHYPSWGSKSPVGEVEHRRAGDDVSLPLMGIEKQRRVVDPPPPANLQPLLITPHGDRKHARTPGRPANGRVSLPLMGIENRSAPPEHVPELLLRLITPHGDRKLRHRKSPSWHA